MSIKSLYSWVSNRSSRLGAAPLLLFSVVAFSKSGLTLLSSDIIFNFANALLQLQNKLPTFLVEFMKEGDKVFARQGPLFYDATIIEIKDKYSCVIHFAGFDSKHDEIIRITDLKEINTENKALKENLEQYYSEHKDQLPNVETQLQFLTTRSISLELPLPLRARLADDFEAITRRQMLVPLPSKINVHEVMKRFAADQRVNSEETKDDLQEFCRGLIWYFKSCLPTILLYPHERLQFRNYIESDPSYIYGADHLLRLMVKMPLILKESNMSSDRLSKLQQLLMDLMNWLQHHKQVFSDYITSSMQYTHELEHHILL